MIGANLNCFCFITNVAKITSSCKWTGVYCRAESLPSTGVLDFNRICFNGYCLHEIIPWDIAQTGHLASSCTPIKPLSLFLVEPSLISLVLFSSYFKFSLATMFLLKCPVGFLGIYIGPLSSSVQNVGLGPPRSPFDFSQFDHSSPFLCGLCKLSPLPQRFVLRWADLRFFQRGLKWVHCIFYKYILHLIVSSAICM